MLSQLAGSLSLYSWGVQTFQAEERRGEEKIKGTFFLDNHTTISTTKLHLRKQFMLTDSSCFRTKRSCRVCCSQRRQVWGPNQSPGGATVWTGRRAAMASWLRHRRGGCLTGEQRRSFSHRAHTPAATMDTSRTRGGSRCHRPPTSLPSPRMTLCQRSLLWVAQNPSLHWSAKIHWYLLVFSS